MSGEVPALVRDDLTAVQSRVRRLVTALPCKPLEISESQEQIAGVTFRDCYFRCLLPSAAYKWIKRSCTSVISSSDRDVREDEHVSARGLAKLARHSLKSD